MWASMKCISRLQLEMTRVAEVIKTAIKVIHTQPIVGVPAMNSGPVVHDRRHRECIDSDRYYGRHYFILEIAAAV